MTALRENIERHTLPFIAALIGCTNEDAWQTPLVFQTFDDVKPGGKARGNLARVFSGSFDEHAESLDKLNQAGAGIFVTVNPTAGGRKKEDTIGIRAWWTDLDLKDSSQAFDPTRPPLEPSMIVETPGGWHLYWIALDPMPCEDEARRDEHEAELRGIQQALKAYGADPKVCDVSRVLRLPGFLHRKAEPRLVELVKADGPRWNREDVRAAFPPLTKRSKEPKPSTPPHTPPPSVDRSKVIFRAGRYLDTMQGGIQTEDGSGATFNAALKICTLFALPEDEALSLMLDRFNPRCEPAWSLEEMQHKVSNAWIVAQGSPDLGRLLNEGDGITQPVTQRAMRNTKDEDAWEDEETASPASSDSPWPEDKDAPPNLIKPDIEGRPKVPGFEWKKRGLYKVGAAAKVMPGGDELPPTPPVWIAPPFTLPGLVRDGSSQGWQLLVAWDDLDGVPHEEALPFELMSGEGAELARTLGQGGMVLSPEPARRKDFLRYLCGALRQVKNRVRLVDSLGWHEGAFVLPGGQTIGKTGEPVRFAGEAPGLHSRASHGTLEGWKNGVACFAVGNPRLVFSLACAFAGPLMGLVRPDGGGGFNLQGSSSKGKTTCLESAASVWGRPDPLPTWRATSSGLEGIAAARNDGFLVLDELSQVDAKEAGQVAYMLANGSAKARANREGGARAMKQWRLIFLSSGEQGLEDKLSEEGKKARAGQEVRVPDIPCPASGMFDDAHGFSSLGDFAEHLKAQARLHYGHAARAFLEHLCDEWNRRDALQSRLKAMETAWLASAIPAGADAQVCRVAGRFALVGIAGELAQRMKILPWPEGESERAALVCFKAWLDRRGFSGASEVYRGIAAVLAFLEKHGQSRFDEWGDSNAKIINRAGTKKRAEGVDGWDFFITPEAWKEVCQGFTASSVARACADAGILEPDEKSQRSSRSMKIPGHGKARCYIIRAAALGKHNEAEAA
ncbi:MAG: DUF927 domain-containing protein [Holophagaceae bacterium]|nr:DUF927 domain-containing protein [Holophagaceae bacterium]